MSIPGTPGSGLLRQIIEAAAPLGRNRQPRLSALTVLKPEYDPYRFDTEKGHINAAWFAAQAARFWPDATIHLRGMHYRLVVANTVRKPNGDTYVNTDADWKWLQEEASAAGRWLAYVPFSSIIDERNGPPLLFVPDDEIPSAALCGGVRIVVPSLADAMPSLEASGFVARQPNRVVLIGEKSSLADVLQPIAERIEGELILPTGEATITQIAQLAARADADGRRLVVIYFSDFDPAGHQMPVSVSRKLQALRDLEFPNLEIEVYVAALTRSQCEEYDLPSTPLKDTEKRGDNWRAVMGREQTEIDALAALRPDVLRQIAEDAVAAFCDDSLDERTEIARDVWTEAAALRLAAHSDYDRARQAVRDARDAVLETVERFHAAQDEALALLAEVEPPEIELPEAQIDIVAPLPLFDSDDDFASATLRLIAHKALNGEGGA